MNARVQSWLQRAVDVRPHEKRTLLWSTAFFFCLLSSWYILRPIRESMGVSQDVNKLPRLYWGTFILTLLATPLFSLLVNRYTRERFVPIVYHFFAANIIAFSFVLWNVEADARIWTYRIIYIWSSMFILFSISVFWGLMADIYQDAQGKRMFGFIAAGGSLGGVLGSFLTKDLVPRIGIEWMLLIAAAVLECGVLCFYQFIRAARRDFDKNDVHVERAPPADPAMAAAIHGVRTVAESRYLTILCLFMLLFTAASSFAYFTQSRIVDSVSKEEKQTTAIFAQMDLYINIVAFVLQFVATARLIRWAGVPAALGAVPIISFIGFALLSGYPSLTILFLFQIARRGGDFAFTKAARDLLYTVVPWREKYTAKTFVDTFVYRGGDMLAAVAAEMIQQSSSRPMLALSIAGLVVSIPWIGIAFWLGREQERRAKSLL
ncbi:MAG: NTP/NDP exchange transporter [Planctomycetota bacterium]